MQAFQLRAQAGIFIFQIGILSHFRLGPRQSANPQKKYHFLGMRQLSISAKLGIGDPCRLSKPIKVIKSILTGCLCLVAARFEVSL
jgi:hypothetical protein